MNDEIGQSPSLPQSLAHAHYALEDLDGEEPNLMPVNQKEDMLS